MIEAEFVARVLLAYGFIVAGFAGIVISYVYRLQEEVQH